MALETEINVYYADASAADGASEEDVFTRTTADGFGEDDDPTAKLFAGFGPEGGDFEELSFS